MSTEPLSAEKLQSYLVMPASVQVAVTVLPSIDSTSDWCRQKVKQGVKLPLACFAEEQTRGRGRRGKPWLMPPRSNIAMSLAWIFAADDPQFHLLSLNIALAVVDTLEALGVKHVQIKWPNDVYVRGRKIAGILIETLARGREWIAVIGIGLNYDMSSLGDSSLPPYTDVCSELESVVARNRLGAELLTRVAGGCEVFSQQAYTQLERFCTDYDFCRNKTVEIVTDNHETVTGVARGVNHLAELVVDVNHHERRVFNSADVRVKQIG